MKAPTARQRAVGKDHALRALTRLCRKLGLWPRRLAFSAGLRPLVSRIAQADSILL